MTTSTRTGMSASWPALPYEAWRDTRDTLHAHTQILGKLAAALAPPEPQLQHAALHLTTHGWETPPLPAPDGSGALVVALDLHAHDAVVDHSDGRTHRVPLVPDRPVAEVTRDLLATVGNLVGDVQIDPRPQETPRTTPLDEDLDHARYDPPAIATYFEAATQAAMVLPAVTTSVASQVLIGTEATSPMEPTSARTISTATISLVATPPTDSPMPLNNSSSGKAAPAYARNSVLTVEEM